MTLRHFLPTSLLFAPLCACYAQSQKPNILFILVDDMQSGAIHALGNNDTHTPSIDGMMDEGFTFTNTYINGALCGALSMPSRAMLLTGRGLFEVQGDGIKIPEGHTTFPQYLGQNGYQTFATGKWHSDKASFNRSFAEGDNIYFGGMHPYETNGHCSPHLHHYDPTGVYAESPFVGTDFSSKMYADAAVRFLESRKEDKRPFMAYVAFTSPHDPRNQLPAYGKKYEASSLSLPANFLPAHPFDNGEMQVRDELLVPAPRTEAQVQKELAAYYGMVSEVDVQIGRILKTLEETGQKENTIIVFASDNGLAVGRHGLLGKQNLYDHSVGVPLTIIDPSHKGKGKRSKALCYLYDVYPTLCDKVGLKVPATVTGQSLNPVLVGKTKEHRDKVFLAYSNLQRALVKDGYKYIIYNVEGKTTEQLFNLKKDPLEMNNIIDRNRQKASEFRKQLSDEMKQHGDFCNLDNSKWWKDGHKLTWDEMLGLYIYDK